MQIGMANPRMGDFQQHLLAGGFRRWDIDFLKGLTGFNYGPGTHGCLPHVSRVGSMGTSLGLAVKRRRVVAEAGLF
jgi:hypothetical protein